MFLSNYVCSPEGMSFTADSKTIDFQHHSSQPSWGSEDKHVQYTSRILFYDRLRNRQHQRVNGSTVRACLTLRGSTVEDVVVFYHSKHVHPHYVWFSALPVLVNNYFHDQVDIYTTSKYGKNLIWSQLHKHRLSLTTMIVGKMRHMTEANRTVPPSGTLLFSISLSD